MFEARTIAQADQLDNPVLRETYLYWRRIRGPGGLPAYDDIDPVDMPRSIVQHLILAEAEGDPAIRS